MQNLFGLVCLLKSEKKYYDDKLIHWFASNLIVKSDQYVSPIPLGIENRRYLSNGRLRNFYKISKNNNKKKNKVMCSFSKHTNPNIRTELLKNVEKLSYVDTLNSNTQFDYLTNLNSYKFNLCPEGNAVETHRFWESLSLNVIPICQENTNNLNYFNIGVPMILVDDWNNIKNYDIEYFLKQYESEEQIIKRPFKSHLRNAQYIDFHYSKLPRSLRYTDRASMRSSVEARLPLLDHEVVEQCFQIPSKFKFLFGQDRIILKDLFKKNINQKMLFKNKRTIADPQSVWIKKNLLGFINDTLNSKNFLSADILNNVNIKEYLNNVSKRDDHFNSSFLIRILLVEWWRKQVVEN